MKTRYWVPAMALCLGWAVAAGASDTVRTTTKGNVVGRVTKMSAAEVTVDRNGVPQRIAVNEIKGISYEQDPMELGNAQDNVRDGQFEDALTQLAEIQPAEVVRREIQQEIDFLNAFCQAQLALRGDGDATAAGKALKLFIATHDGNYHWLQANEVLGELYVAFGAYSYAEGCYAKMLEKAPWPDYKIKISVAIGRAQLAQKHTAEARQSFNAALAIQAPGDEVKSQHLAATLGVAQCLGAEEKFAEAEKMINDILAKADLEQAELHARAYNALGTVHRNAGRTKEAVMDFLHVHIVYNGTADAHAEALANLVELWTDLHKTERAGQMQRLLQSHYGGSPWAKRGG